jgi:integrase
MGGHLTPKFVRSVTKPGEYHDSNGLYLKVRTSGSKAWSFRYMRHGVPRKMGLGSADAIGLAEARDLRDAARNKLKQDIDPIDARKQKRYDERVEAAKQITLAEAREGWLKIQDWHPSSAYRETWLWKMYGPKLESYTLSELADGNRIVAVFTEIINVRRFKKSARYALQHLRGIFEWAKDENLFTGDNPVNLKKKSKFLRRLPSLEYEIAHRRAMPHQEVPAFVARLRAQKGNCGRFALDEHSLIAEAFELQILTGGRPVQARLAQWDEFDLDNQTWKVPLHTTVNGKRYYRRKRKGTFAIYINRQAVELLRTIKKRQEMEEGGLRKFVFSHGPALIASKDYHPSSAWRRRERSRYGDSEFRYGGTPITDRGMNDFFRNTMGVKNYDPHGFRGSFKQWSIAHGYNDVASEAVLDHQVGTYVRNVYAQGAQPYLQVIEMMDHWGQHCDGKPSGTVIQGTFRQRKRRNHAA